jgi:hypothetical protein
LIQCGAQPVQFGRPVGGDVVFGGAVVGEVVEFVALGPDQTVAAVGHRPHAAPAEAIRAETAIPNTRCDPEIPTGLREAASAIGR